MRARFGMLGVAVCSVALTVTVAAQDATTQAYRELVFKKYNSLFNLLRSAERSQKEDIPGHLGLSEAKEVAERYAKRAELQPFVDDCKAGKYASARDAVLPPERACALAANAGDLLEGYMEKIVSQVVKHSQGNARASLTKLQETGCTAGLENFYVMAKPDAAQAKTQKDIEAVYATAGLKPPAGSGMDGFSKSFEEAVSAAIANAKPSKSAKKDAASEKAITSAVNKLCKTGVDRHPPRRCSVIKAWMTTDEWEVFKTPLDVPRRRTREGKALLRLADRKHCLLQHVVVAQEYAGGKYTASKAELGIGACPVVCK